MVTPFERMQLAHLSSSASAVCTAEPELLVVVVEPLAKPFEGDPPQAASNTATTTGHHYQGGPIGSQHSWRKAPFERTVRDVCAGCNNSWMAELEDHARPLAPARKAAD